MPIFPPVVSNQAVQSIDATTATIVWDTNAPADSRVEWSIVPSFTPVGTTTTDPSLVTSHSVLVTGLTPGTQYTFTVISNNGGGQGSNNCNGNTTATFQNFTIQQVSLNNIVITCESNALAGSPEQMTINYGPVGNVSSSQFGINLGATSGGFFKYEFGFKFNLSQIEFNVFLTSNSGGGYAGFTSNNQIVDVPPILSSITNVIMKFFDITDGFVYFTYTGSPSDIDHAFFYFSASPGTDPDEPFGYTNSVRSVSNLGGGNYRATFSPFDCGITTGQDVHFTAGITTIFSTYDRTPDTFDEVPNLFISNATATNITSDSATITWITTSGTEISNDSVAYGVDPPGTLDQSAGPVVSSTLNKSVDLSGLLPQTIYDFTVSSINDGFSIACSGCSGMFTTLPPPPPPPPPPDPIIQGLVRKAPPFELNPDFYQQDLRTYEQRDKEYLSNDISGPQFR